jgi:hypothetical protein
MSQNLRALIPWAKRPPHDDQIQSVQLVTQSVFGSFLSCISAFSDDDLFRLHVQASEIANFLARGLESGHVALIWKNRILSGHELILAGHLAQKPISAKIISSDWEPGHASART